MDFNTGWSADTEQRRPEPTKPAPRFSPKIVAAIHAKPLPEYIRDREFDEDRPKSPGTAPKKKPSKPKKDMQAATIESSPAAEAGKAPEGIQSTKDYTIFRLLATNRPVDVSHVNRLAAAIRVKNLLNLNPIVVNASFEVIEGQHRLEAAKKLGVSVFYIQDDQVTQDDMAGMNSNKKNWALKDYIHFYAAQGVQEYQRFTELCELHPAIPPATLLTLCAKDGKASRTYKEGKLDVSEIGLAQDTLAMLPDFQPHTPFYQTAKFIEALAFLVRTGLYDHSHMLKKLEANPGTLQPQPQVKGYIESLQRIYNRHMRDENLVVFLKRI